MKAVVAKNLNKNVKMLSAAALALALLGCGKAHITVNSSKAVASSVQTASGALQVTSVWYTDMGLNAYGLTSTLSHAGRVVNLSTGMVTFGAVGTGSQTYSSDYYSISTACATDACDQIAVLYDYSSYTGSRVQFAVLYQAPTNGSSGSVTKLSEADDTSFSSAEDAIYTLKRMRN